MHLFEVNHEVNHKVEDDNPGKQKPEPSLFLVDFRPPHPRP
jgi:hypothetical protein